MKKLIITIFAMTAVPFLSNADIIHFKGGKKISVQKAWEEGDLIKCIRFGGIVAYPKSRVEKIEKETAERKDRIMPEKEKSGDIAAYPKSRVEKIEKETSEREPEKFTNSMGMEFVLIHPGTFMIGSPEDEPGRSAVETRHQVTLTRGFYMQTTEVTQGQWKAVMGYNRSHFRSGDNYPAEKVSWNDIQKFIRRLYQKEGGDLQASHRSGFHKALHTCKKSTQNCQKQS